MAKKKKQPESVVIPADLVLRDWKRCGYAGIGRLVVFMAKYIQSGIDNEGDYSFDESVLHGRDPIGKPVPADVYQNIAERVVSENVEAYLERCEKNSENGKKGGAPSHKKDKVPKVASGTAKVPNGTKKNRMVQKSTEVYRKYPNGNR